MVFEKMVRMKDIQRDSQKTALEDLIALQRSTNSSKSDEYSNKLGFGEKLESMVKGALDEYKEVKQSLIELDEHRNNMKEHYHRMNRTRSPYVADGLLNEQIIANAKFEGENDRTQNFPINYRQKSEDEQYSDFKTYEGCESTSDVDPE